MLEPLDDAGLARVREAVRDWPRTAVACRGDAARLLARLDAAEAERGRLREALRRAEGAIVPALRDFDELINPLLCEMAGVHPCTLTPRDLREALAIIRLVLGGPP